MVTDIRHFVQKLRLEYIFSQNVTNSALCESHNPSSVFWNILKKEFHVLWPFSYFKRIKINNCPSKPEEFKGFDSIATFDI